LSIATVTRGTALALAALIGLSACGGGSSPSATASGPAGATLIEARVKDAIVMDPAQATDGMSLNLTQEILKGLVDFKLGTFQVQPAIAQRWTTSPDGRIWTFTLKPGLKFSDGTPVDAAAVKFNFDRWRLTGDPYHGSMIYGYYASMFGGFPGLITDVRDPKPDTVVISIARPFSPFLHDLAMPSFAISSPTAIRANADSYGQPGTPPVGWGPYTLAEWVKDDHITLAANPTYPIKPAYTTIVVRDIPDQSTSVLEMQKGTVDILTDPRPDDAASLAKQTGLTVAYQPANNNSYVAFNMDRKPFDQLDVRRAIAYAIDVNAIVKGLYPKGAMVAANWTPPGMIGENPAVKPYPHDVAKAKQLLAAAGFPKGFATELYYPTLPRPYMPEPQRIAETIQADLAAAGIAVTLQPFEWGVFLDKVRRGEHPMCLIGWSGDNGDPDNFMVPLLDKDTADAKPNGQNYSFWRDETFHRLLMLGQATVGDTKRAPIYAQANARISDQVPALPIVHVTVPIVLKDTIGGFVPSPDTHVAFEFLEPKK
jgi:peptide/nickel transport system substrate-binding protein